MITKFKTFEKKYIDECEIVNVKCNWCDWFGNYYELKIENVDDYIDNEYCPRCGNDDFIIDININELIGYDFIEYMKNNKPVNNIKKIEYSDPISYYKALYPLYFDAKKYNL